MSVLVSNLKNAVICGLLVVSFACGSPNNSEVKVTTGNIQQQLQSSGDGLAQAKAEANRYPISEELRLGFQNAESSLVNTKADPSQLNVVRYCSQLALLRSKLAREAAIPVEKYISIGSIIENSRPQDCSGSTSPATNPWVTPTPSNSGSTASDPWGVQQPNPAPNTDSPYPDYSKGSSGYRWCPATYYGKVFNCGTNSKCAKSDPEYLNICEISPW